MMEKGIAFTLLVVFMAMKPAWSQESATKEPTEAKTGPVTTQNLRDDNNSDITKNLDPYVNKVDVFRYRLVPGDQVRIDISGPLADVQRCAISGNGSIFLAPAGKVYVANLTLGQAEEKLDRIISRYIKHGRVNLTLLSVRRFPVEVSGEVKKPGIYQVTGLTSLSDLLQRAGGFTAVASQRRVSVLDMGSKKLLGTVDFVKFSQEGDLYQNIVLKPNEAVFVPPTAALVNLVGEVAKPGAYELMPGEKLSDLVHLAGGYSAKADTSSLEIGRLNSSGQRDLIRVDSVGSAYTALQQGDRIEIFDRSLNGARVRVVGELESPLIAAPKPHDNAGQIYSDFPKQGSVYVHEGETVRELVLALGGPTSKADIRNSWLERVDAKGIKTYYPVNLDTLLHDYNATKSENLILKNGDIFVVPPVSDSVFVVGQVTKSGPQPWTPGLNLRDYLSLAGGPNSDASTKHARLIRRVPGKQPVVYEFDALRVLENGWDPALEVRAGDVVFIPHFQTFYKDTLNVLSQISPLYLFVK